RELVVVAEVRHAGVQHRGVEREIARGALEEAIDVAEPRQIRDDGFHLHARALLELLLELVELVGPARGDDEVRLVLVREELGELLPEARARAGHEDPLAAKIHRLHAMPFWYTRYFL